MIPQYAVRRFRVASEYPDLRPVGEVNSCKVIEALYRSSEQLEKVGVRHALVGGLAVGAWGYPRASRDVDFLVGNEAFVVHEGGFVTFAEGVPISFGDVAVDSLSVCPGEGFLQDLLESPVVRDGIPILAVEGLVYLKLKSPRAKDGADIVELVKAGVDVRAIRNWLKANSPFMLEKFDGLARKASEE